MPAGRGSGRISPRLACVSLALALGAVGHAAGAILDVASVYQQHIGLLEIDYSASAWVFEADGRRVYVQGSGPGSTLVALLTSDSATGALTYQNAAIHPNGGSPGGFGLARHLVFGPGDHQLYAVATAESGVVVLSLDPGTGAPSVLQQTPQVVYQGSAPRMNDLVIAPDGAHLYAAFNGFGFIAIYPRASDGRLGSAVLMPLDTVASRLWSLAMAPDGRFLYAVANDSSGDNDALLVFARSPSSGSLQLVQRVEDNLGDRVSLGNIQAVAMSPDGSQLYVANGDDPEPMVTVFARDADSGRLSLRQLVNRGAAVLCAGDITVSGDGSLVYIACVGGDSIGVYHRATPSGILTLVQTIRKGMDDINSIGGIDAIAASLDGRNLYVVADDLNHNVTVFRRVCGDGVLDTGEACDDGNLVDGDGCDAACQIEPCFACSGTPSLCMPADGAACDDGNPCTGGDVCQAGVCQGNVVADGTSCDDGDVCTTGDACHGGQCVASGALSCGTCESCDAAVGCVGALASECQPAPPVGRHGVLDVRARPSTSRSLAWRWAGSQPTTTSEFGDPAHTTGYHLCLFDHAGLPENVRRRRRVVFAADIPAGGTCDGRPCWRARAGGGFVFRGGAHPPDGISAVMLTPGPALTPIISVSGAGAQLRLGSLPATLRATMQLSNDVGTCWQADYATFVRVNTARRLTGHGGLVRPCRGGACGE